MDPLVVTLLRRSCTDSEECRCFDSAFQHCFKGDPSGEIRPVFDAILVDNDDKEKDEEGLHPFDLIYSMAHGTPPDDDEEDFEIIAAMAAASLSKKCTSDDVVIWNHHVKIRVEHR